MCDDDKAVHIKVSHPLITLSGLRLRSYQQVMWLTLPMTPSERKSKTLNTKRCDSIDTTRVLAAPANNGTITYPIFTTFKGYGMAEFGGSQMVKAMFSLAQMKATIARRKAVMAMAKALVDAMLVRQKADVIKGKIKKATAK